MWTNPVRDKPVYEQGAYIKLMYQQNIKKYPHVIKHIVDWWPHMAMEICVNNDSGNGWLSDRTNPLDKPVLTNIQWGFVAFTCGQLQGILKPFSHDKQHVPLLLTWIKFYPNIDTWLHPL